MVDISVDWYGILLDVGEQEFLCIYCIVNFKMVFVDKDVGVVFLKYKDFKFYVDYFNSMEDENIVQVIFNVCVF